MRIVSKSSAQHRKSDPQKFAVIGDPIAHSLSPFMQQAAFDALRISASYFPLEVAALDLPALVSALREEKVLAGLNVTLPHKEHILPLLDGASQLAKAVGAVNTVFWDGDALWGDNTDVEGFTAGLLPALKSLRGKRAIVFGAGGASRAVLYALGKGGVREGWIVNRSVDKARALAHYFSTRFPHTRYQAVAWEDMSWQRALETADLLVNATSLGLGNSVFPKIPFRAAKKTALAYDLLYTPFETSFLKQAKRAGLQTRNGLVMFVVQGGRSFFRWTGKRAPLDVMEKAVCAALLKQKPRK